MKPAKKHILYPAIIALLLSMALVSIAVAAQPAKILILPFNINADKDLSFLQRGIKNMLFSRLSMEGKGIIIDPLKTDATLSIPPNNDSALALGRKFSADYVLLGNLTVFGDSVSTDCSFLDVKKGDTAVTFGDFGESHGDALAHINAFATQVRERVFGYAPKRTAPAQYSNIPAGGYMTGGGMGMPFNSFNANIWKSGRIKARIKGMSLGDVDGNGNKEMVILTDNQVLVYRFQEGRIQKIAEHNGEAHLTYLGVDVADINGNGKSEIFITAVKESNRKLRSHVLEWNESGFNMIASNENWFFRVLKTENGEKTLLGQRRKNTTDPDIFERGIHRLKWEGGAYVTDSRLVLPKEAIVYGLAFGDVLNNGQESYLLLMPDGKIRVLDTSGKELWTSSDRYGGGINYLKFPSELEPSMRWNSGEQEMDYYYIQQRIHVADIDKDGKNEVVVANNQNFVSQLFEKIRNFDKGHIDVLMWNSIGLQEKWKLPKVVGSITDYTIDDLNNDGRDELIFSVMEKGGLLEMSKQSYVATWNSPN